MDLDLRTQRELDRLELVSGLGEPGSGRMCIMALVARLAGEGHTDSPACASSLVRAFAIPINDHMPRPVRQRLKPFAPRILGTADGREEARAALLRRALAEEILPALQAASRTSTRPAERRLGRLWDRLRRTMLERRVRLLLEPAPAPRGREADLELAGAAGRLMAWSARERACEPRAAERCWAMALDLLDRLCDPDRVADGPVPARNPARPHRTEAA